LPNHPDGLIEIALPGGVSVRVDAHVDGGALRRVLAALVRR
jgi:transposase